MKVNKLYYFSGTHWDREWYQTYQGFRFKLDRALREMIEYLEEHPEFPVFYFDGQTIVFEDFLEVSPEYSERLNRLIQEGRIVIGPWYTMPDEFLVSGEALIRNLKLGHRICEQYGTESWKVGYICDIFGHIAQMPQIFAGFDIHTAVLGRGTNENTTPMFFHWVSPDGTCCTTYKVPNYLGYGSFAPEVVGQRNRNEELSPNSGEFREKAKIYIDREIARSNTDTVVIMDAADHEPLHPFTPEYIEQIRNMYPSLEVVHGNFEEAFQRAQAFELPVKNGELIETASYPALYLHLITNTLSSRIDNKGRNDRCENLLEKWAEPFVVYLNTNHMPISKRYLDIAWKHLLQNHPHDSICGCSVDRVHDEMNFRFSQVESITDAITEEPLLSEVKEFRCIEDEGNTVLNLFSMSSFQEKRYVTVQIPFSTEYPSFQEPFGYEPIHAFRLLDVSGKELPYRIEKIRRNANLRTKSEVTVPVDLYTITFEVELEAFGCTRIEIQPQSELVRYPGRMADYEGNLENACMKVSIETDGRITIYDKRNGKTYSNLLGLLSDDELGDGWWSVRSKCGEITVRTRLESVEILANNETGASVRLVRSMDVPEEKWNLQSGMQRSTRKVPYVCETILTLNSNEDFLRVKTIVHNTARDHRLRMHLPTDTQSENYKVSQSFAFVERKAGIKEETLWYEETDPLEKNMSGIIYRTDKDGNGLAFISQYGIHEAGGDNDARSSMLITLLRSFSNTHTRNDETGGQVQGDWTYEFALKPLAGDTDNSLQKLQNRLCSMVYPLITDDSITFAGGQLHTEGNVVVSCVKPLDDGEGVAIRVYNTQTDVQPFTLHIGDMFTKAFLSNMMEENLTELAVSENTIHMEIPPAAIVSLNLF